MLQLTEKDQGKLTSQLANGQTSHTAMEELLDLKPGTAAVFTAVGKGVVRAREQERQLRGIAVANEKQLQAVAKAEAEAAAQSSASQETGQKAKTRVTHAEQRLAAEKKQAAEEVRAVAAAEAACAAANEEDKTAHASAVAARK
jgi:hypothetical protein